MPEQSRTLGVKVRTLPHPVLHFRPDLDMTAGMELRLNNTPMKPHPVSNSQTATRELILQLIEALKEL
jgi:hypothetical protein